MAETVYLETSIFGYLTARPSQNLILVANVEVTREWWQLQKNNFQLYVSQVVLDEVSRGDLTIASQRVQLVQSISALSVTRNSISLGKQFLAKTNLPQKAELDTLHIAIATVHGLDYLLTWNCKHIANAKIQKKLAQVANDFGFKLPILCTPYELSGD